MIKSALAGALALALAIGGAQAQTTRTAQQTYVNGHIAANGTQAITGAAMNTALNSLITGAGMVADQNTWTQPNLASALWTFTHNLYLPMTVSPSSTAAAANRGIYANETITGSCSDSCKYNVLSIGSDAIPVGSGAPSGNHFSSGVGWYFNHNIGGTAMTGSRATVTSAMLLNSKTGNTIQNASYSAITANASASVNDNGTGGSNPLSGGMKMPR